MQITSENISFALGAAAIGGVIFKVYSYFKNPQVRTEQTTIKLKDDVLDLQRQITEIKETHLRSLETEIKSLNTGINDLSKTVVKLATIIDERIPRSK